MKRREGHIYNASTVLRCHWDGGTYAESYSFPYKSNVSLLPSLAKSSCRFLTENEAQLIMEGSGSQVLIACILARSGEGKSS